MDDIHSGEQFVGITPQVLREVGLGRSGSRVLNRFGPSPVKVRRTGGDQAGDRTIGKQLQVQIEGRPAQPPALQRFQGLGEVKMTHGLELRRVAGHGSGQGGIGGEQGVGGKGFTGEMPDNLPAGHAHDFAHFGGGFEEDQRIGQFTD